ncbi:MAG: helix-turn-helix domain-containing protein, partial [Bacteroidales bacterium]|nr:helix-turn-helix domain-containing protein [Bacteroidales bacterium]
EKKEELSGRENERIITLEQMEKKMMKAAIKRCRGNISLAAEQLGVTRQTLYNKGKKYKLFD